MELYEYIVDNLFCGMILLVDGRVKIRNIYAAERFGIEEGMAILDFIHEDDRERIAKYNSMRLNGHEAPVFYTGRAQTAAGEPVFVNIHTSLVKMDQGKGVAVFFDDVTDRHLDLERIEKSEENLRSIIEASLDAVVGVDETGNIVVFNQAAEELFKYREAEIVGKPLSVLLRDEYHENHQHRLEKFLTVGAGRCGHIGRRMIKYFRDAEGRIFEAELAMSGARSRNNRFIAAFIHDITEKNRIIRELGLAEEKARTASTFKTEFVSNVSHEIRTPMNTIIGYADLMLMDDMSDAHREYLGLIKESSELLLNIVDDLIDLSKVEAGKLKFNYVPAEVGPLFEGLLKQFLLHVGRSGKEIDVRFRIDSRVGEKIVCDPLRLKQVLINLVYNGIKYTDCGFVEFGVRPGIRGFLEFYVTDTGKGISEKDRLKVFEKYFRAAGNVSHRQEGAGLGLAITRQIVELMGGRINLASSVDGPERGTTFIVSLPLQEENCCSEGMEAEVRPASGAEYIQDYTVMVVEDNIVNQTLLRRILKKFGLECRIASNSSEMINYLRAGEQIDLVFMDLCLAGESGFDALDEINVMKQAGELRNNIPVIALTAATMSEDREKCISAGFDDYLTKPVNIDLLQNILYKYLIS